VAAAGFTEEFVEVVERAEGGIDSLRMSWVGLQVREEDGVGAKGADVVQAMNDAVKGTVAGGAEVGRVDLINDGALPPEVGGDAGANPAGAGEGLGFGEWSCCGEDAGEAEGERSAVRSGEGDHALVIEMLREMARAWGDGVFTASVSQVAVLKFAHFLVFDHVRFYGQ
jgi:hypothetical protein